MSSQFANYVPVQDIITGGGDSVIRIKNAIPGNSVSFPSEEEITNSISQSVGIQVV